MVFQNRHVRNTSCFALKGIVGLKILPWFVSNVYYFFLLWNTKDQFLKDILVSFFSTLEVNEKCTIKVVIMTFVLYSYDSNLFKNRFKFWSTFGMIVYIASLHLKREGKKIIITTKLSLHLASSWCSTKFSQWIVTELSKWGGESNPIHE